MRIFALSIFFSICIEFPVHAINGLLVKTIDYSYREKWNNTLGSSMPKMSICDTVFRKQNLFLTAIAWDFAFDKQDISDVQYSLKITKPDHSIYFSQENLALVAGKISYKNNFQMSDVFIEVSFEEKDTYGKYTIEIQIADKISGETKSISSDITLSPLPDWDRAKIKDEAAFSTWFTKYYENPKPEKALAYYIFYSKSSLSGNNASFLPVFSIFREIANNNLYLLPQIIGSYKNQDFKTRVFLLYLLMYSNIGANDFLNDLEEADKDAVAKMKGSSMPDIYGSITDASQLDMLWGIFMASGSYQPILKLIQTLDYVRYKGYLDQYKTSKKTEEDRQKAVNNAIYDALVWSFSSNCKQHELVKGYSLWALQHESLTDVQKEELKKILRVKIIKANGPEIF